jgi:hypothetical protein
LGTNRKLPGMRGIKDANEERQEKGGRKTN